MRLIQAGTEDIKGDTEVIRKALPDLEDGIDALRNTQLRDRVSSWICGTDYPTRHADIISQRQAGTGMWFLESPIFRTWVQGPKQTLFCPGIPGAGKTMIAAIAIDHLLRTARTNNIGIAFSYCSYNTRSDLTLSVLLAGLVKQLIQSQSPIPDPVMRLYDKHRSSGTSPTLDEMSSVLLSVLSCNTHTYIVIDALDEYGGNHYAQHGLVRTLQSLQGQANLCLMFTSRYLPEIERQFTGSPTLPIRATEADVRRFLDGEVHRLPRCVQRDTELQDLVKAKVAAAVDGM